MGSMNKEMLNQAPRTYQHEFSYRTTAEDHPRHPNSVIATVRERYTGTKIAVASDLDGQNKRYIVTAEGTQHLGTLISLKSQLPPYFLKHPLLEMVEKAHEDYLQHRTKRTVTTPQIF